MQGLTVTSKWSKIIQIWNKLELEEWYLNLIALDFSKAFDTVRHSTLLGKCADLPIEDCVYNWLMRFFESRQHCTKIKGDTSFFLFINASIVQGSGIGLFMYVINASDLHARHILDMLNKYADDSYLIVPPVNSQLVQEELDHISKWAANNNLALNVSKTKEMIVKRPHTKTDIPPVTSGVERVAFMNILGVMFQENMSFTMQVDRLVARVQCTDNVRPRYIEKSRVEQLCPMGSHSCHTSIAAHIWVPSMVGDVGRCGAPMIARYHQ